MAKLLTYAQAKLASGRRRIPDDPARQQDYGRWQKGYLAALGQELRSARHISHRDHAAVVERIQRARKEKLRSLGVFETD